MTEHVKIAIVGSGPSGLSAAARAAELGVSHVLLEAARQPSNTIYKYQKGKHVMAEPGVLPLRSPLSFTAGTREVILGTWDEELRRLGVNVRFDANVMRHRGPARRVPPGHRRRRRDHRRTRGAGDRPAGQHPQARRARRGPADGAVPARRPRRLRGRDHRRGRRRRRRHRERAGADPAEPRDHHQPRRGVQPLQGRQPQPADGGARRKAGSSARLSTTVTRIDAADGDFPLRFVAKTATGEETIKCHRVIARLGASPPRKLVEGFGVVFPNNDAGAVPRAQRAVRIERAGPVHRRRARRLSADQAGDEPGLRGRRVHPRQPGRTGRRAAAEGEVRRACPRHQRHRRHRARSRRTCPCCRASPRCSCASSCSTATLHAPKPGEVIFERNDYTNSFYSHRRGRGRR